MLTLYAGKKIGDLVLSWVSQEQGDVQLIGYIEGAPPAPMANLTNKPSYAGRDVDDAQRADVGHAQATRQARQFAPRTRSTSGVQLSALEFGCGDALVAPFGFGVNDQQDTSSPSKAPSAAATYSTTWDDGERLADHLEQQAGRIEPSTR